MSELPDYPERERFIPYIPGFIHGGSDVPVDISFELRRTLLRFANQWTMPEDYYLLKYTIEAFKNNKICFPLVAKKLEDLCFARFFVRPLNYFNAERCQGRLNELIEATKDDPEVEKTDSADKYSLKTHVGGLLDALIKENNALKSEFLSSEEKFRLVLRFFRGDVPPEDEDAIHSAVDEYWQIIIETTPSEAAVSAKAIAAITDEELSKIQTFDAYQELIKQKIALFDSEKVVDTRMSADEQLMNLWENIEAQAETLKTKEEHDWPTPPEIPAIPRTTSLSPREQVVEAPSPVPPPPPTLPAMESTVSLPIPPLIPPKPEPMDVDIPVYETPGPPTPIRKETPPTDATFDAAKKSRGRPKKILTLDIPQTTAKKAKISSREASETPKTATFDSTPESAIEAELPPVPAKPAVLTGSKMTPVTGSAPELSSMEQQTAGRVLRTNPRSSIKEDLPIREARRRTVFYTPTTSPRASAQPSPKPVEEMQVDEPSPQAEQRGSVSRPGSSVPFIKSCTPRSERTSEERKPELRSGTKAASLPKQEVEKKPLSVATKAVQTFLIVPNKVGISDDGKPQPKPKIKIFKGKAEPQKEDGIGTQTGPLDLDKDARLIRFSDDNLKSSFAAKQLLSGCYTPSSRFIRNKTCRVHFSVERRSLIDIPKTLKSHTNFDVANTISKLNLGEAYLVPARFFQPKYRRVINKPMDQLTIRELMNQGQIKGSIDFALNSVLMCANNVVFSALKKDKAAKQESVQNSTKVLQTLRKCKE
uniref:Bromo domain-containing protein n=1 Tax=Panagrolaimus sp. JU765 TaxID=591449 RepID=A0AC34QRV4_9BILA